MSICMVTKIPHMILMQPYNSIMVVVSNFMILSIAEIICLLNIIKYLLFPKQYINSNFRDEHECLNANCFISLKDASQKIEACVRISTNRSQTMAQNSTDYSHSKLDNSTSEYSSPNIGLSTPN